MKSSIIFLIVFVVLSILCLVLSYINRTYCMIFDRKEYKAGKLICEHLDDMVLIEKRDWDGLVVAEYALNFDDRKIKINYYPQDDTAGAWEDGGIIFCGFDKYHKKKIVEYIKANE